MSNMEDAQTVSFLVSSATTGSRVSLSFFFMVDNYFTDAFIIHQDIQMRKLNTYRNVPILLSEVR
jgi:hypothetical protein